MSRSSVHPRSGKSTALRTLITALAATHDPGQVQFYCLDFGGGALASVRALPHVGAVAGRAEPRLVGAHDRRVRIGRAIPGGHLPRPGRRVDRPTTVGYEQSGARRPRTTRSVTCSSSSTAGRAFVMSSRRSSHRSPRLRSQGLSFGVHVVLSASRWAEIRPSLKDQIGTRIELRLGDPADSELDRKRAQQVPHDRPGRGLSREGLHMVIALPLMDGIAHGESVAPPIPLLPTHVDRDTVVGRAGAELGARILLGLEERRLQPVAVDFERQSHLLVLGDNECGKTATLRTLCREIVRTKTAVAGSAADRRLSALATRRRRVGTPWRVCHVAGRAGGVAAGSARSSAAADAPCRTRARRSCEPGRGGPGRTSMSWSTTTTWSPPRRATRWRPSLEYLPYARDLGLHLVVARRSGGAERALFEPLLAGLRDLGCMSTDDEWAPGRGRTVRFRPPRAVATGPWRADHSCR